MRRKAAQGRAGHRWTAARAIAGECPRRVGEAQISERLANRTDLYDVHVPTPLRRSLVVDAIVDGLLGMVLFVAPEAALRAFGWHSIDSIATRLLASALLGMSAQTWLGRNGDVAELRAGLNLKVIWTGPPRSAWPWRSWPAARPWQRSL